MNSRYRASKGFTLFFLFKSCKGKASKLICRILMMLCTLLINIFYLFLGLCGQTGDVMVSEWSLAWLLPGEKMTKYVFSSFHLFIRFTAMGFGIHLYPEILLRRNSLHRKHTRDYLLPGNHENKNYFPGRYSSERMIHIHYILLRHKHC